MIKNTATIIVLLIGLFSNAQDSKFSASVAYPIPVGDNFVANYNGVLDVGIQYHIAQLGPVKIGASCNATYLNFSYPGDAIDPNAKRKAYFVQPRVFGELHIESLKRFKPTLGVGYTYLRFNYKQGAENIEIDPVDYNGFNVNIAGNYDITSWLYASLQYEFVKIKNDNGDQIKYNTNFEFVKFGLGFRF